MSPGRGQGVREETIPTGKKEAESTTPLTDAELEAPRVCVCVQVCVPVVCALTRAYLVLRAGAGSVSAPSASCAGFPPSSELQPGAHGPGLSLLCPNLLPGSPPTPPHAVCMR